MSAIIVFSIITIVLMLVVLLLAAQQEVGESLSMADFDTVFRSLEDLTKDGKK